MAKAILCVCFAFLLVVTSSASSERKLMQSSYNCGGLKELGKSRSDNNCCGLCWCIGENSDKRTLAIAGIQKLCKEECSKCVEAAYDKSKCPTESSSLPDFCNRGLSYSSSVRGLSEKCLGQYRKDKSAFSKALGC